jgi:GNAT superfamily N-acetyltransferase
MSVKISTWTATNGAAPPADFLERFQHVGAAMQATYAAEALTPPSYIAMLLRAAAERPVELTIVSAGGRDVARAGSFVSTAHEGVGLIGLYEAEAGRTGDEATELLVERAVIWAAGQRLRLLYAPVDANTWFRYRFAIGSPDRAPRPFAWEPQQPDAYRTRFLQQGFAVADTFETMGFDFPARGAYTFRDLVEQTRNGSRAAAEHGFVCERLAAGADPETVLRELHPLCMEAFADNLLFQPISLELFVHKYRELLASTPAHMTFLARGPDRHLAGFLFAFPDRGWIVIKTVAVAVGARGQRLASALLHEAVKAGADAGLTKVVTALVRADNDSRFLVDPRKMPSVARWERTYELLSRTLPPVNSEP